MVDVELPHPSGRPQLFALEASQRGKGCHQHAADIPAQTMADFAPSGIRYRFGFSLKIICRSFTEITHWLMVGESAHALKMN
jgi:hypothetical protein